MDSEHWEGVEVLIALSGAQRRDGGGSPAALQNRIGHLVSRHHAMMEQSINPVLPVTHAQILSGLLSTSVRCWWWEQIDWFKVERL